MDRETAWEMVKKALADSGFKVSTTYSTCNGGLVENPAAEEPRFIAMRIELRDDAVEAFLFSFQGAPSMVQTFPCTKEEADKFARRIKEWQFFDDRRKTPK